MNQVTIIKINTIWIRLTRSIFDLSIVVFLVLSPTVSSQDISAQTISPQAPEELMQFGRLVGKWKIRDQSLDEKGNWQDGAGADWNFYWILGGNAVQDEWISPGMTESTREKGRQFGTNIRTYNPKTKKWEMIWTANTSRKIESFSATGSDDSMVMEGFYNGSQTRITFYNITNSRFSWKMEKNNNAKKEWQPIYKIEALKIDAR
ncbi:MAG: hypothetical protein KUG78_01230 [Kangiellaceae bacterium]|nr:hypothetical protein [Kangiellaceae bacterium]